MRAKGWSKVRGLCSAAMLVLLVGCGGPVGKSEHFPSAEAGKPDVAFYGWHGERRQEFKAAVQEEAGQPL